MDETKIKLEVRLVAAQHLAVEAITLAALAISKADGRANPADALAVIRKMRETTLDGLRELTLPVDDSALSDHVADEIQHEVDRLLSRVEATLGSLLRQQR